MRNHFEHELFRFPPFPPHFSPWDSFGPFDGHGAGWPNFNRPGCRPHGPPGCRPHGPPGCRSHGPPGCRPHGPPGCRLHGPPGFTNCFGPPHHRHHDRHRSPSPTSEPERPRFPDHGHHGWRNDQCKSPRHHDFPRCGRGPRIGHHGEHENERCSRGSKGSKGGHHHHHWPGFGPRFGRRDFFDSHRFGPDHCEPNWGPRFGHRRPEPCGKPPGCDQCEDCRNEPCCSGNKDTQASNKAGSMRKENKSCSAQDKDQDETGDTVLVQRIIVERAPIRPTSV